MIKVTQFVSLTAMLGALAQGASTTVSTTCSKSHGYKTTINLPLQVVSNNGGLLHRCQPSWYLPELASNL